MATPTMPTPNPATIELIGCFASEISIKGTTSLRQLLDTGKSCYTRLHQFIEIGLDLPKNQIGLKLLIEVTLAADEPKERIDLRGRFEIYFNFEVANLKDLLAAHSEEEATMPTFEVAVMLTSISYSTARGILMTRLAGTPLDGFSLPVINDTELVTEGELITTTQLRN